MTAPDFIVRYVLAYRQNDHWQFFGPRQGRYTYASMQEAQAAAVAFRDSGTLEKVLTREEAATLCAKAAECWPNHFDPCQILGA